MLSPETTQLMWFPASVGSRCRADSHCVCRSEVPVVVPLIAPDCSVAVPAVLVLPVALVVPLTPAVPVVDDCGMVLGVLLVLDCGVVLEVVPLTPVLDCGVVLDV